MIDICKLLLTETLTIPDIAESESNNCFIIHYFKENNDTPPLTSCELGIALGNHALRAQPTDYSLIRWQISTD